MLFPALPSLWSESLTNYHCSPKYSLSLLHPQQSNSFFSRIARLCLLMASLELTQDRGLMANLTPFPHHFWWCSNMNNSHLRHFPESFSPSPKDTICQKMSLLQFFCAHLLEYGMRWEKMAIRIKLWIKKWSKTMLHEIYDMTGQAHFASWIKVNHCLNQRLFTSWFS